MPEFLRLLPPDQAMTLVLGHLLSRPVPETVALSQALGRVTVKPIVAPHPLPAFTRSSVDGYAVRAVDTFGASESLPVYLPVNGEVLMGTAPAFRLDAAGCALIHTGGMLPLGADAVVMVENTQLARPGEVEVFRAVAVGVNVIGVGEDVTAGQEVISKGTRLRPAEIGGLAALGIIQVEVTRRPRVGILSSGDEVIPPERNPQPGQVRDVNTYTLAALVEQSGGSSVLIGIIPDVVESLWRAVQKALEDCDMVVITAGSSASSRDLTAQVINQSGQPGVLVHGVNVRPGKPTILGVCDGRAVIGLPGNPVSALVIAGLFITPLIDNFMGVALPRSHPSVPARLTVNLPSQAGREDWVPVHLIPGPQGYQADPLFGKSNLIFTLVRADGLVRIPPDATGLEAGAWVEVWFL